MDDTKYGKYFIKEPYMDGPFVQGLRFYSKPHFGEKHFSMMWHCIPEPIILEGTPHHHDFDQFLWFYGGNPLDVRDFRAEAELYLGEEGEKHIITETQLVHIPKGLIHCPLNFIKVEKPVIFMNVPLTPEYTKYDK